MHIKLIPLFWPSNKTEYRDMGAQKVKLGHFQNNLQLFTNFAERPKSSGTVPIWLIYGAMESSGKSASKEYSTCIYCINKHYLIVGFVYVHCSVLYYDSVLHIFTPDMELRYKAIRH
jgi:hypothetical protein